MWRFEALRKVPILFSLSNSQLFDLAQCMKYHTLQAGQVVFKKGEPGETYAWQAMRHRLGVEVYKCELVLLESSYASSPTMLKSRECQKRVLIACVSCEFGDERGLRRAPARCNRLIRHDEDREGFD